MESYSQVGQDKWVLSLFPEGYKGTFMDLGCQQPEFINNTKLLEEYGWDGVSFDIGDYAEQWKSRNTKFIQEDVFKFDFNSLNFPKHIDYLSLDVCGYHGVCRDVLRRVIGFGYEFKCITIEHNLYFIHPDIERNPQRIMLLNNGYIPLRLDVDNNGINIFEDWWINPKYFDITTHAKV